MRKSFHRSIDFYMIGMSAIFMTKNIMIDNAGWSAFWAGLLVANLLFELDRYWENKRKKMREDRNA